MSLVFFLLACFYFSFFIKRNKDILNPNMVFLIMWNLSCAISCIDSFGMFSPWSTLMYFVTIVSGISFFLGSTFYYKSSKVHVRMGEANQILIPQKFYIIVYSLYLLCALCALLEWFNSGAPISLNLMKSGVDIKSELDGAIPGVHYGTIFMPYVSIFIFFILMNRGKYIKLNIFLIIISIVFSIISNLSRGELLIYILSLFYLYYRYRTISKKSVLLIMGSTVAMLIVIMIIRVNSESIVLNMTDNPYLSVFYSYIAPCFANLNDFINLDVPYSLYGNATFRPIWTIIGEYDEMHTLYINQFGVFNATPYLYGFYHDYKIIGIIFFPFLLGYFISNIYYSTVVKSSYWILLLAALQKAVFMPFFGNYFCGEMVILFPFLLILLIIINLPNPKLK